ncbi:MAG: hypothetical protein ABSD81_06450 [Methanomicrobiales archaeon]|jgi:hypothetical protein
MKRAWKILIAGVILSAVLFPGMTAAQGGSIQFSKAGDIVTISGQTNLAVGDILLINVVSAGFTPTEKGTGGGFAGAGGSVVVQPGSPLNTYSFLVNVSTFPSGEYLVTVESVETGFRDSAQFVLPWTPVPTQSPMTPIPGTATISTPATSPPATVPAQAPSPTPAPIDYIVPVTALVLAICILVLPRRES